MRTLELFAGIGACSTALKRIGIDVEIVDAVEIDKYAIASFNAIHNTNFKPQDITQYNKNFENIDFITHGSPCQDFSVAGKQAGGDLGSGTRSSLLYETLRIVGQVRPKYILWENVKNILSAKHKHNFDNYINATDKLGYNSYYEVLNAKDYGIPQNRERVYTVSIRKDIDKGNFKFPEKEELKIRLKDMLEETVDEKYYLKENQIKNFIENNNGNCNPSGKGMNGKVHSGNIAPTITTNKGEGLKINVNRIGGIFDTERSKHQAGSVYDKNGLSPTISTMQGGYRQPIIEVIGNYSPSGHNASRVVDSKGLAPTVKENHGTVTATTETLPGAYGRNFGSKGKMQDVNSICNTLQAAMGNGGGNVPIFKETTRIRKLTPKECWRLMGFSDEDFKKAVNIPTSNAQLYKQAGNSIVVNVLEKIFKNLFKEKTNEL